MFSTGYFYALPDSRRFELHQNNKFPCTESDLFISGEIHPSVPDEQVRALNGMNTRITIEYDVTPEGNMVLMSLGTEPKRTLLSMTEEQAVSVTKALDCYAHLCLGQVETLVSMLSFGVIPVAGPGSQPRRLATADQIENVRQHLESIKEILGYSPSGSMGIKHAHVSMDGRRAYEVLNALQNREGLGVTLDCPPIVEYASGNTPSDTLNSMCP